MKHLNAILPHIRIFGWIIIILLPILIILLSPPIRRKLKEINLSDNHGKKKKIADFYEKYLHIFVIARQMLLFLIPMGISSVLDFSIISEHFLSLIVLGISLVIFVSIQFPLLMRAHILVTFLTDDKKCNSNIIFKPGRTTYVEIGIWNLGFSTYKNSTFIFYFGRDFEIIPCDDPLYKDLDFKKKFDIQKRHGGLLFTPKDNFLTIPPQEVCVFPMYIKAPDQEKEDNMNISFYSENTWGMNRIQRQISVKK